MGTSSPFVQSITSLRDHPHACGDKLYRLYQVLGFLGSSPRVWGQVMPSITFPVKDGIIPTRVGTRPKKVTKKMVDEDHPHACGDKEKSNENKRKKVGSSPRVWGQVCPYKNCLIPVRIIPTRVGTSSAMDSCDTASKDHPHACGDKRLTRG